MPPTPGARRTPAFGFARDDRGHGRSVFRHERRRLAGVAQATYYLGSGVWPLLSSRTFQAVTGPKKDVWLVQTVGALIGVVGGTLTLAVATRQHETATVRTLALGSALSLAAADVYFVARRRISPIYLVDSVLQLALVAGWLVPERRGD